MNKIAFPGLGLEFNISKIAFEILGVEIYWYALLIVSAMVIAICIFKKRDGLYKIKFMDILDLLLYLIPISLISARIYYIIFNLEYYIMHPIQVLNIRNGGLAIYGGIIGGVITCVMFCKKRKIDIANLLDYIVPGLVLGQAIGRWGNFVNVEAYGIKTSALWRMKIYEAGNYIEVHPTFLYESLACMVIFIILLCLKNKRKFKGQITLTYLIFYSIERMLVEGLRTDSLILANIKVSQALSIILFIISFLLYILRWYELSKNKKMS